MLSRCCELGKLVGAMGIIEGGVGGVK